MCKKVLVPYLISLASLKALVVLLWVGAKHKNKCPLLQKEQGTVGSEGCVFSIVDDYITSYFGCC